jgi:hypothetical protein
VDTERDAPQRRAKTTEKENDVLENASVVGKVLVPLVRNDLGAEA